MHKIEDLQYHQRRILCRALPKKEEIEFMLRSELNKTNMASSGTEPEGDRTHLQLAVVY